MKEEEIEKLTGLMDNLIEANDKDPISSQDIKDLMRKNISKRIESIRLGKIISPSEHGKPITMGIWVSIGEFKVSRDVMETAHAIDDYYETL